MTQTDPGHPTRALFLILQGKVQAPEFLAAIRNRAQAESVVGWAYLTYGGTLQLWLQGARQAVLGVSAAVQAGLGLADVTDMTVSTVTPTRLTGFEIREDNTERTPDGIAALAETVTRLSQAQRAVSEGLISQSDRSLRHSGAAALRSAVRRLPVDHLPQLFLRSQFVQDDPLGCSFTAQMWQQAHFRAHSAQVSGLAAEDVLDDKMTAYDFADRIGARRPRVLQHGVPASQIVLRPRVVVKPQHAAAARGVYLVIDEHYQRRVRDGGILGSYDALAAELARLPGARLKDWDWAVPDIADAWIIEELVSGEADLPAHDLKFYCFYGHAPLCLEIRRNGPDPEYCWWDRSGTRTVTGKYDDHLFVGEPLPEAWFREAERISLEIPAPFMRIDFLRAPDQMWLGEFTPRPGAFQNFDITHDRSLGQEYVRAQVRLQRDLMQGKAFEAFNALDVKGLSCLRD